jgi:diacylglycerol kinase family enzyme
MRVTLIHNPKAGDGSPTRDELVAVLVKAGHDVTYHSTLAGDFEHCLSEPGDLVVACGGDGTVAKVTRRMVGRNVPVAVIPLGTANNIATALGVHGSWKALLRHLDTAERRKLDVGVARASWGTARFVESAGLGLFAELLRHLDEAGDPPGKQDTADAALSEGAKHLKRVLKSTSARKWKVEADGVDLSGEYLFVAALNICCLGPRVMLAPGADPGDGHLDLVLIGEEDRPALHDYLKALRDDVAPPAPLTAHQVRRVKLVWDAEAGHLDDERWPEKPDAVPAGAKDRAVELEIVSPPVEVLVHAPDD